VYFQALVDSLDSRYRGDVEKLKPLQRDEFSEVQSKRAGLGALLGEIDFDISQGNSAQERIDGHIRKGRMV